MKTYSQQTKFFGTTKVVLGTIAAAAGVIMALVIVLRILSSNHFFVTDKSVAFDSPATKIVAPSSAKLSLTNTSVLSCPTSQLCYAIDAAGNVGVSNDQGKTWQTSPVNLNAGTSESSWKLSCPDEKTCYATVHSRKPSYSDRYFSTKDGGQTWTTRTINGGFNEIEAISCPTAQFCVAVTSSEIQTTRDGGQTWTAKSISNARFFKDVTCIDATTCFVVGGVQGIEESYSYLFVTNDGGKNWAEKSNSIGNIPLENISCPDKTSCIVGGANGMLYRITQDGNNWEKLTYPNKKPSYTITSVSCQDSSRCIFIANTGNAKDKYTYFSKDGGKTWQLNTTISLQWANCFSSILCYGSTTADEFVISKDGGETWSK